MQIIYAKSVAKVQKLSEKEEQFIELGQVSQLTLGPGGSLFEGYSRLGSYDWQW